MGAACAQRGYFPLAACLHRCQVATHLEAQQLQRVHRHVPLYLRGLIGGGIACRLLLGVVGCSLPRVGMLRPHAPHIRHCDDGQRATRYLNRSSMGSSDYPAAILVARQLTSALLRCARALYLPQRDPSLGCRRGTAGVFMGRRAERWS